MKNIFLKNKYKNINNKGFSVIEVIIASFIISTSVFALMLVAQKGIELSNRSLKQTQAIMLLEEGVEAVKAIRNDEWTTISNLTNEINYYLFFDTTTNSWSLDSSIITPSGNIPSYPVDGIFGRVVNIYSVDRDSNDDIDVTNNGTLDEDTKRVVIEVSWQTPQGVISRSLEFYLLNIFN